MPRKQLKRLTLPRYRALPLLSLLINVITVALPNPRLSLTRDAPSVSNVYIAVLTARDLTGKMDTTNSVNYWLLKPLRLSRTRNDF
jgi:hypothetical protein